MAAQKVRNEILGALQGVAAALPRLDTFAAILMLIVITVVAVPFYIRDYNPDTPGVEGGKISFENWDFAGEPVKLTGDWEFFYDALLATEDVRELPASDTMPVPGIWERETGPDGKPYPVSGVATYRLIITGLSPGYYEFYFPAMFTPDKIWLDRKLISTLGILSRDPEEARTVWDENIFSFYSDGSDHELLVEVAAWHHTSNGIEENPMFAPEAIMERVKKGYVSGDVLFQTMLALLAIYSFAIFVYRRLDLASLFFGFFCVAFSIPTLTVGTNFVLYFWPEIPFPLYMWLIYIPTILTAVFFLWYITQLNRLERVWWVDASYTAFALIMGVIDSGALDW